jgi:hypothetical protein
MVIRFHFTLSTQTDLNDELWSRIDCRLQATAVKEKLRVIIN